MKHFISNGAFAAIVAGALLISSCSDRDLYNSNYKKDEYAANWEAKFGQIDPTQDWNMATKVTANANIPGLTGQSVMTIYTTNPGNEDCAVLATKTLDNGNGSIAFDVLKNQTNVYVVVNGQNGFVVNGYYPIENGMVSLSKGTRAATRVAGEEKQDRTVTLSPVQHPNEGYGWGLRPAMEIIHLSGVKKETIPGWTLGDWEKIVGNPDGRFVEGKANKYLYDELNNEDVIFTLSEDGSVSIKDMYGATDYYNQFGYFYYTGEPTAEELSKVKKYVIMENASVHNNISLNGEPVKKCGLATIIGQLNESWQQHQKDEIVFGSEYKLVYWGPEGNSEPSYIFPKGTKIGFFIHKLSNDAFCDAETVKANEQIQNNGDVKLMFSIKKLNAYYNMYGYKNGQPTYDANNPEENGDWTCVSYKYGNTTVVGFEDGYDNDMNDIMWFVEGNFEETEKLPQMGQEVKNENYGWILACEDLGDTDDYDFNDIVLEVVNNGDGTIDIKCLAAGGTLPANILYDGMDLGEVHDMFGVPTSTMVNTINITNSYPTKTVYVEDGWTIADNINKFSIVVSQNAGNIKSVVIESPEEGKAPQIIVVPGEWEWPKERTSIESAYPAFRSWSSNANLTEWREAKAPGKFVKRR